VVALARVLRRQFREDLSGACAAHVTRRDSRPPPSLTARTALYSRGGSSCGRPSGPRGHPLVRAAGLPQRVMSNAELESSCVIAKDAVDLLVNGH
jgi:hypothetical protein